MQRRKRGRRGKEEEESRGKEEEESRGKEEEERKKVSGGHMSMQSMQSLHC